MIVVLILMFLSYIPLLIIFSLIADQREADEKNFERIYFSSKILTIKNIVQNNHNSKIIDKFSSSGEVSGLTANYKHLLKLSKKTGCGPNYKQCGILDTVGNILCIEDYLECPINKMKVDYYIKTEEYLNNGYSTTRLSNITDNFRFFYSNDFIEGNAVTIIIKDLDESKYITMNNFLIDLELFEDIFGSLKVLEDLDLSDILDDDNKDKNDNEKDNDDEDEEIKIVQLLFDDEKETGSDFSGAKVLFKFFFGTYDKKIEKPKKYVEKKLSEEEDENTDIYFNPIGDFFYIKNYIGFDNVEDLNKFMKFDYDIVKKAFPTFTTAVLALVCAIIISLLIIALFIFTLKNRENYYFRINKVLLIIQCVFVYGSAIGFFIYSLVIYKQVNKNEKLEELKSIKSDKFIENFINEFISKCQESTLIISTIIICIISFILNLISVIIYQIIKD